jgi:hypothetical protein
MKTIEKATDRPVVASMLEPFPYERRGDSKKSSFLLRLLGEILCPGLPPWQQRTVALIMLCAIVAGILTGVAAIVVIRL